MIIARAVFFILCSALLEAQNIDGTSQNNSSQFYWRKLTYVKDSGFANQTSDRGKNARLYPQLQQSSGGGGSGAGDRIFPEAGEFNTAVLGQFPYFVYLTVTTQAGITTTACNGALISNAWVVTAAQCVYLASSTLVNAAAVDFTALTADPPPVQSYGEVHIHPGFRSNYMVHDIALIRLLAPFQLSANIYPIKLSKHDADLSAKTVRTVGIGVPVDGGLLPEKVFWIELVHMNKHLCKSQAKETYVDYPATTGCLSTSSATRGFCYGDAGGPVLYTFPKDVSVTLIGINSVHQGCPSIYPSAYTRIAPYYNWIKNKVKKLL